ncbi:MAG: hypothetical protein AB1499_17785, partial [Nitrospirota bacterium]
EYFDNTIKLAPGTDLAAKAAEYLNIMEKGDAQNRWTLNLSVGEQYDSNVVLGPENGPKSANITRESDWRTVLYLKGRYSIFDNQNAESSVAYSLYQSLHNRLSDFNVTQHLMELKGSYELSQKLTLKGMFSTEYVYVGWDDYDYSYSVSPSLMISEGRGLSTEIEYRYKRTRFMDSDLFQSNSDRTGHNNLAGIAQNIPLGRLVSARLGYSYDEDSAAEDFWDYTGNKVDAGLKLYFIKNSLVNLSGEYYNKQYKETAPSETDEREDDVYTASISYTRLLSGRCSITAGQLYTRNDSNIEAYDYKRSITSVFITAKFN